MSIILTIPDPKIVGDTNLFYDAVNLFDDVLNNHSHFKNEVFNDEKRNFLESWSTIKDKKRLYAGIRFNTHFYAKDLYGYPLSGKPEDLKRLEISDFESFYNNQLNKDHLLFVFNGHFNDLEKDIIKQKFNSSLDLTEEIEMSFRKPHQKHKIYMEKTKMNQAQIRLGYIINVFRKDPLYYAALLVDLIIGSYADSRLFKQIRENFGLCYDISSNYDQYKGTLVIGAGVDRLKKEEAIEKIIEEMEQLVAKGIDEIELKQAKSYLIHQIKASLDNQSVLTSRTVIRHLLKLDDTLSTRISEIESVTIADVSKIIKQLKLDTIYVLYGGVEDGE